MRSHAGKESTLGLVAASPEAARAEGPHGAADPTYAPSPERPTDDRDALALGAKQSEIDRVTAMFSNLSKSWYEDSQKTLENMKG